MSHSEISTIYPRKERYNSIKNINIGRKNIYSLSYVIDEEEPVIFCYIYQSTYGSIHEYDYVCIGNNIISRDGSYMSGFSKAESLNIFKEDLVKKIHKSLEKIIPSFVSNIVVNKCYDISRGKLGKIDTLPLHIKIFIIYLYITHNLGKPSRIFSNSIIQKIINNASITSEENINHELINSMFNTCGQKIIPKSLYYKENSIVKVKEYRNELSLLYSLSKKVFGEETPSFPIIIDSRTLNTVELTILDNISIKDKIISSDIISKEFGMKYKIPTNTGKINIIIMENCGEPLSTYLTSGGKLLGDVFFSKRCMISLLFQFLHSVYMLNKSNFIHGDTHLNNVCVRETVRWYNMNIQKESAGKSQETTHAIFSLGKHKMYIEFYGAYIALVDMGRSLGMSDDIPVDFIHKVKKNLALNISEKGSRKLSKLSKLSLLNMCDIIRFMYGIEMFLKTTSTDTVVDENNSVSSFINSSIKKTLLFSKRLLETYANGSDEKNLCNSSAKLIKEIFYKEEWMSADNNYKIADRFI